MAARRWLSLFLLASGLFVALPLAAPALAWSGHDRSAGWIYAAYRVTCHQLPQRSWFLGGDRAAYSWDEVRASTGAAPGAAPFSLLHKPIRAEGLGYQMAFCQRDTAIYLSLFLATAAYATLGRRRRLAPLPWRWYALALVPIAIDGTTQLVGWRESTPMLRSVTGALFGGATAMLVLPHLAAGMDELADELARGIPPGGTPVAGSADEVPERSPAPARRS